MSHYCRLVDKRIIKCSCPVHSLVFWACTCWSETIQFALGILLPCIRAIVFEQSVRGGVTEKYFDLPHNSVCFLFATLHPPFHIPNLIPYVNMFLQLSLILKHRFGPPFDFILPWPHPRCCFKCNSPWQLGNTVKSPVCLTSLP